MANLVVNALRLGKSVHLNVWQDDRETDVSMMIDDISFEMDDESGMIDQLYEAMDNDLIESEDKQKGYGKMILTSKGLAQNE
jgi:hypothetical protein